MPLLRVSRSSYLKGVLQYSIKRNFGACSVLYVNQIPTDNVQKLFLEKLREYTKKSAAQGGGIVDATPGIKKEYDESLSRIQKMYGADKEDFTKFPSFSFKDPKLGPLGLSEKSP